jgi:hypothetical protein
VQVADLGTFSCVRILGFLYRSYEEGEGFPRDLAPLMILEDDQQRKFLVRAKSVQAIITPPLERGNSGSDLFASQAPAVDAGK